MAVKCIEFQCRCGVASLTLNRPKELNALSASMIDEIIAVLGDIVANSAVRVLLIRANGKAFCAGADLKSPAQGGGDNAVLETHYSRLLVRLVELSVPVVAAVNGPAVGAGCGLALLSDFVIASDKAYFLQAFVNIGLVPDMGMTWLLPRLLGVARAREMLMLGEKVPADRAAEWGMIYRAVDAAVLEVEARALAERLAAGPTRAYGLIRQGLNYGLEHSLAETLGQERRSQLEAARSADFAEGLAAFKARRPPDFTGQ